MTKSVRLRDVEAGDLPALSALLGRTWHATYDGIYGPEQVAEMTNSLHSPAALQRYLASPCCRFVLAEVDGAIAGCACMSQSPGQDELAQLHMIYVLPEMQGRGLGKKLLDVLMARLPELSLVSLEVDPQNKPAIAFYTAQGFVTVGTVCDCAGAGYDIPANVMELTISKSESN